MPDWDATHLARTSDLVTLDTTRVKEAQPAPLSSSPL
jgi:hypothetical protein